MTGDAEIGAGERDYPDLRVAMWFFGFGLLGTAVGGAAVEAAMMSGGQ